MNIETPNLIIRPFFPNDVDDVFEYMSDREAIYYLAEDSMSREEALSFISETKKAYGIIHKKSGKLVGHLEFYAWFGEHTYEIGWVTNPLYRRQGIALEAAFNALKYGFER